MARRSCWSARHLELRRRGNDARFANQLTDIACGIASFDAGLAQAVTVGSQGAGFSRLPAGVSTLVVSSASATGAPKILVPEDGSVSAGENASLQFPFDPAEAVVRQDLSPLAFLLRRVFSWRLCQRLARGEIDRATACFKLHGALFRNLRKNRRNCIDGTSVCRLVAPALSKPGAELDF